MTGPIVSDSLLKKVRQLINTAKQQVAVAVDAELILLCRQVGTFIQTEIFTEKRVKQNKQVI